MIKLGLSAFYHDSAACLTIDGKIVAAAEEERFTEIKHDNSFPYNAIKWALHYAGKEITDININQVAHINVSLNNFIVI